MRCSSVDVPHDQIVKEAKEMRKALDSEGLVAEFVAPRLWEHPLTVDGGYTANDAKAREYALERSRKAIDIANIIGSRNIVLWPAREGFYVNESKDHVQASERFVAAVDMMLQYDKNIRVLGEMKPNEPMDHAYLPTTGHFLSICYTAVDPAGWACSSSRPTRCSRASTPRPRWPSRCTTRSCGACTSTTRTA